MDHKIQKALFIFIMILLTSPVFAVGNDNSEAGPEVLSLENCLEIAFQNSHEITGSDADQDQVSDVTPSKQISTAGISLT